MLGEFDARSNDRRQAGFTLLEMIIVIAVLGMALGLVVTRGPMRSQTMEMQAAVNQVAQGLRVARFQGDREHPASMSSIDRLDV
jgi:prepilin-type N-terminal cleavage/methylation domain-containing protein